MTTSSKEEILRKYAELINPPLIKTAWSWKDIAQAILPDVLTTGAAAAIFGPGAAITLGSNPVGWVIGSALITGGLVYAIYEATKITDDNLEDLIERLNALDPNERAKGKVDLWIKYLTQFKQVFALTPTTSNVQERAQAQLNQLMSMGEVAEYLAQMKQEWPQVKANLTDIGWDPGEAEKAIDLTLNAVQKQHTELTQRVREASVKQIQEFSKKMGQDYAATANAITRLYDEISKLGGKAPTFDTAAEASAWELAQRITGRSEDKTPVSEEELKSGLPALQRLMFLMEQGKQHFSTKPAATPAPAPAKASEAKPPISKRALTLGDGTRIDAPAEKGVAGKGKVRPSGDQRVLEIQKAINHLAAVYAPKMARIDEDGIYGTQTSAVLVLLMRQMPSLAELIARYTGANEQYLRDYRKFSQDKERMDRLHLVMKTYLDQTIAQPGVEEGKAPQQRQQVRTQRSVSCPLNKGPNITTEEINACLMDMDIYDPGVSPRPIRADEWLNMNGYHTPEQRAAVVHDALSSGVSGLPIASQWMEWGEKLRHHVSRQQGGQQYGRGQFGINR